MKARESERGSSRSQVPRVQVGVEPSSASSEASQRLPNLPAPTPPGTGSHLRVSMPLHVHEGKGADVTDPRHVHSKVPKEVDNLQGPGPKPEEQKQGCEDRGQELLHQGDLEKAGPRLRRPFGGQPGSPGRQPPTRSFRGPPPDLRGQPKASAARPASGVTLTARYCNSRAICL